MNPEPDTEFQEVLNQCLERIEEEGMSALESFCGTHPSHAVSLRKRIESLRELGLFAPESQEFPKRLGEFRLLERLGGGGMGVVYCAVQEGLGRNVALKVIRSDQLLFEAARQRFEREAALLSGLRHPNIVPVHTYGVERGVPYFAMEYLEGKTLADVLQHLKGRAPESLSGRDLAESVGLEQEGTIPHASLLFLSASWAEACLRMITQVARALDHAHQQGVIHRDVKPSNLMLLKDGRVVLFDFGLASSQESTQITRTGSHLGSLAYMSPEQARGEAATERSDVYSLGLTLYELLTFRNPFLTDNVESTRSKVLSGIVPAPRKLNEKLPEDLETVTLKAIALEAKERYASASDFAQDLENLLALRPIQARRPSVRVRTLRWMQRNPARAVAWVLGFLLLISLPAVYFTLQKRSKDQLREINRELESANIDLGRGLDLSLQTIDVALREIADERLRFVPGMQVARARLLEVARQNMKTIQSLRPDHPETQRIYSSLLNAEGAVLAQLGRASEAADAYREGIETQQKLIDLDPKDVAKKLHLAKLYINRGMVLTDLERLEEARESYEKGIRANEAAYAQDPSYPDALYFLAMSQSNFANHLCRTGAIDESVLIADSGVDHARTLVELHGALDEHELLAQSLAVRAFCVQQTDDLESARSDYEESYEVQSNVNAKAPGNPAHAGLLLVISNNYAYLLLLLKENEAAKEILQGVVSVGENLLRLHPLVQDYEVNVAKLYNALGTAKARSGTTAEGVAEFRRAREIIESSLERNSNDMNLLNVLGLTLNNLADVHLKADEFAEATQAAERAMDTNDRVWKENPKAFGRFSQAEVSRRILTVTAFLQGDQELAATHLRSLVELYQSESVPLPPELESLDSLSKWYEQQR